MENHMKNRIEKQINSETSELLEEIISEKYNQNYRKLMSDLTIVKFLMRDFKSNLRKLTTPYLCEIEKEHFKCTLADLEKLNLYSFLQTIKEIFTLLIDAKLNLSEAYFLFEKIQSSASLVLSQVHQTYNVKLCDN